MSLVTWGLLGVIGPILTAIAFTVVAFRDSTPCTGVLCGLGGVAISLGIGYLLGSIAIVAWGAVSTSRAGDGVRRGVASFVGSLLPILYLVRELF